jgi:hypothetical protein
MKVIIMGEESQRICLAFTERGHNARSCDLKPCSGGHPELHMQIDMLEAFYKFQPDLAIIHPTCTFMSNSGALRLYLNGKKANGIDWVRWGKMEKSAKDFKMLLALPCEKLVLENPVMHCHAKSIIGVRQSQVIQPYEFGHPESKATCLWVKGLPLLKPTNILSKPECGHWDNQTKSGQNKLPPGPNRGTERSKTYMGIAKAMAEQWG